MAVPTSAMPKAIDAHGDISIVATVKELLVVKAGKVASTLPIVDIPLAVAISPSGKELAVGGEDNKIHLYTLAGTVLTKKPLILEANRGQVSALAYSPDGTLLAAGDADRKIMVYNTSDGTVKLNQWVFHSARVTCIAWSPCGRYAVSGALDRNIHVWSVERPMKFVEVRGAHQEGVTNVGMVDEVTVVSTGQDACVKTWTVVHPRD